MRFRTLAGLLLVLLLASPRPGAAQGPEPELTLPDLTFEDPIVPLSEAPRAPFEVAVGCDAQETPNTTTTIHLHTADVPSWANAILLPAEVTLSAPPGACPSIEPGPAIGATLTLALTQSAPAFETTTFELQAMVWKNDTLDRDRRYGPYTANVTFTPGYFNLYNFRLDKTQLQVGPGEQARFHGTIDNFSNAPTRFSLEPRDVPEGLLVSYEPSTLELDPGTNATFTIVADAGASLTSNTYAFQTDVESAAIAPGQTNTTGASTTTSSIVRVGGYVDTGATPWIALAILMVALVAGIVAWRRQG